MMVRHFHTPDHIEEPDLRAALWQEGVSTGILVESVHRWRGELTEKRPAIIVKRNAYKSVRVLLNDFMGPTEEGNETYSTIWVGSHTLFCIHGTGASVEILATEVQRELTQFGPAIRQELGLKKFQVLEVGQIGEVEEATENNIVPVTVGWAYDETWVLAPEARPLQGIALSIDTLDL